MTDKEQIKAIIKQYADKGERLLEEAYENGEHASTTGYWDGYGDCANLLLRELDDMQEEPVSEDLEKKIDSYFAKWLQGASDEGCFNPDSQLVSIYDCHRIARHFANWQKQKDKSKVLTEEQCRKIRDDAFELGKDAMKQQLMAKAVDIEVKVDAGGYLYIPQIELYDYDKDIPLAKEGDKYKVIVIKE